MMFLFLQKHEDGFQRNLMEIVPGGPAQISNVSRGESKQDIEKSLEEA